jgi:hypothetical protein
VGVGWICWVVICVWRNGRVVVFMRVKSGRPLAKVARSTKNIAFLNMSRLIAHLAFFGGENQRSNDDVLRLNSLTSQETLLRCFCSISSIVNLSRAHSLLTSTSMHIQQNPSSLNTHISPPFVNSSNLPTDQASPSLVTPAALLRLSQPAVLLQ